MSELDRDWMSSNKFQRVAAGLSDPGRPVATFVMNVVMVLEQTWNI
jgi:hypothetical protein